MTNLLFPYGFRKIGWPLFVIGIAMGVLCYFGAISLSGIIETVVNDAIIIGIIIGALMIVCSREKIEDEMSRAIRLASLLNSLYAYVIILITCTICLNGMDFLLFGLINMVLFPIIYVVIFNLEMYRYSKMNKDEEQN